MIPNMNDTLTFSSRDYPHLFHRDDRQSATHGFPFTGLTNDVREWLMSQTPGAYIRGQNVCLGEACIQFKTPEDAVKFKMFVL